MVIRLKRILCGNFYIMFIIYSDIFQYVLRGNHMLYYVQYGDSLYNIAKKFNVTMEDILNANVICNANLIFKGQLLIIPEANLGLPKSGGYPYYIVMPGDSLYCIAFQFNTSIKALADGNQIKNPNLIYPGTELLIAYEKPNAMELFNVWKSTGDKYCGQMSSLQIHGIYYIGTFMWQAIGNEAIPYLIELLDHSCAEVRLYTILSMGRIANWSSVVISSLNQMLKDSDKNVVNMASLALKRIRLVRDIGRRIHVTIGDNKLLLNPIYTSPFTVIPEGTEIRVLMWGVPSPTGEEGPIGDIQIYDYVQVLYTGQVGFLPRLGYNDIVMI